MRSITISRFRRDPRPEPGPPVNERCLRFRDVRVIGSDGEQLGILQSRDALKLAREEGLDLVMVAPQAQPPVCRIIDYGRFKYMNEKRERETKKKPQEVKGIKISPRIAQHDLDHLLKNAIRFLEEGHKVKVVCQFKAREITHPELGRNKLETFVQQTAALAAVERTPTLEGKQMIMVLSPKPSTGKKHAKAENQQDSGEAVQDHGNREDHPPQSL